MRRRAPSRRFVIAALVVLTASATAWAHPGEEHITPANWTFGWSWEPVVISALVVSAFLYVRGILSMSRRSPRSVRAWQIAAFAAGWLTLVLALVSPIHELGSELFSVHMAQHELLMLIAAPLLVISHPLVPMLWALPENWRIRTGAWTKAPALATSWDALTNPVAAWLVHGATLWIWHAPALYQATLRSESIHALQHTMFFASALLFWWTLVEGRYGRLGYGMSVLYVFTTAIHSSVLGALITFSQKLWYPIYDGRTAAWRLTALEDQQLGGLIMWIPAGTVLIAVGLAFMAAWLRDSEKRASYTRAALLVRPGDTHA